MHFNSTILTIPGLGGSGPQHWQSIWEKQYNFTRVEQADWETPACADWIENINNAVNMYDPADVILVSHSLACAALAYWANKFNVKIKGALLVAPADSEAESFPTVTTGFSPMPLLKLPFLSIVVSSTNDFYVTTERTKLFADSWGSNFINVGDAGHINVSSGHGEWDFGLELLKRLDK
ncbi:alpha/beta hydrolase [Mucilaginibacter sp.]|uniref:RBBP9/YdeN family alpha/beta hydrolase n=1 Tax=Mucilaginibacter sp. TaxID=1882438 RepID=UPI00283DDEFF|nr:alpha/beta hydrolase [Mucilaginibacter sp.]MDR3693482.1 alpha/beta hydrolase [Mucilaginibacter sp.]